MYTNRVHFINAAGIVPVYTSLQSDGRRYTKQTNGLSKKYDLIVKIETKNRPVTIIYNYKLNYRISIRIKNERNKTVGNKKLIVLTVS